MMRIALLLFLASCDASTGTLRDLGHDHDHGHDDDLRKSQDLMPIPGPSLLSESGLYADFAKRTLAAGVIPFKPRWELWSDGADKQRWLSIPPGTKIDTSNVDGWVFPVGTRAWKQFSRGGKLLETRLLEKVYAYPGGWYQVAYRWDEGGKEARAVPLGEKDVLGTTHDVPSQEDCARCHDGAADVLIGVSAIQLSDGGKGDLSKLVAAGLLSHPPKGDYTVPGTATVREALGYLHGNCGHCHNGRMEFRHPLAMRLMLTWDDRVAEQAPVYRTTINAEMNHTMEGDIHLGIVPGRPEKSQLWVRMGLRDDWSMPPVCTEIPDPAGVTTLRDWIRWLK